MESEERFNEKFATIDEALKYISDSQAKSEWLNARSKVEHEKFRTESEQRWRQIEKHRAYITKLTGIAFDDLDFQNGKLTEAGKILARQNDAIER
jgi:hypothetical protein